MNAAQANNEIERLEALGCIEYQGSESGDMVDKMNEQMKLGFVKPLGVPQSSRCKKIENSIV